MASHDRSAQAGAYLRMLLARPGEPRSIWMKHARDADADLDPVAIADVLRDRTDVASAVASIGGHAVVSEALGGIAIAPATLEQFIEAFELGDRHARRLRDLLSGSDSVRVITTDSLAELYRDTGPRQHATIAVHDVHTLGPDGMPVEHQTIEAIKSTVDFMDRYPYRFDTDEFVIEVVRGGKVGDTYRVTDSFFGIDIVLDQPLRQGDTALMHYRTTFAYRTPPPAELRRGVVGTMSDVTLWVRFHADRLPARIWQSRWDRLDDATVVEEHLVELDDEYSVQARYETVNDAIIGFHWSWD